VWRQGLDRSKEGRAIQAAHLTHALLQFKQLTPHADGDREFQGIQGIGSNIRIEGLGCGVQSVGFNFRIEGLGIRAWDVGV